MSRLRDDHYCFACGEKNRSGLRVRTTREGGHAEIRWSPRREYQGFRGIVHGGIVSTLLDEAMAHAALSVAANAATARMTVHFERPVATSGEIVVRGRVDERRGRLLQTSAVLLQGDEKKASAEGTFVLLRPATPGGGGDSTD